jgi:hypothetical protein
MLISQYIQDLTYMLSSYIYVNGLSNEVWLFSVLVKLVLHASKQL